MDTRIPALLVAAVVIVLAASGCANVPGNGGGNTQIANPASVYCVHNLSGTLAIVDTPEGQLGYCNLPDGRVCEEWALFRNSTCAPPQ